MYLFTQQNYIGGNSLTTGLAPNFIVRNFLDGVNVSEGAGANVINGNYIGTNIQQRVRLGNLGAGVRVVTNAVYASNDNVIGGINPGEGNVLAYNVVDGVRLDGGVRNAIRRNTIFNHNAGLGIRLLNNANNNQNTASIVNVIVTPPSGIRVFYSMTGVPNTTYTIEFFVNQVCHPGGAGEGKFYIGTAFAPTDGAGNFANFVDFTTYNTTYGLFLTNTTTDPLGNTSQFSTCFAFVVPPQPGAAARPPHHGVVSRSDSRRLELRKQDRLNVHLAPVRNEETAAKSPRQVRNERVAVTEPVDRLLVDEFFASWLTL
jgi:hypothetical protein